MYSVCPKLLLLWWMFTLEGLANFITCLRAWVQFSDSLEEPVLSFYLDRAQYRIPAERCVYLHPLRAPDLHTAHHPPGCCPADLNHPTQSMTRSWSAGLLHTSPPVGTKNKHMYGSSTPLYLRFILLMQQMLPWKASWLLTQNPAIRIRRCFS